MRSQLHILGPVDTAFYYVDRPETPMNIGALNILDGRIDFDAFLKMVEARIYRAPLYLQRVIQAPLTLGQPSWVLDPDFSISNHVFGIDLPKPGDDEALRTLCGQLISGMLDRSKPLWEIYLISGLERERSAILFKVHHCMVDGLSAVELFTLLMDLTPEPPPLEPVPIFAPPSLPSQLDLISRAIRADVPHRLGVLKKIGSDVGRLGTILGDKEKRRQTLIGVASLINDNLSRIKQLPINGRNTGRITLGWAEFNLEEIHAIRAAQHASVNEVMLTVLGGALDLYLRGRLPHVDQKFLRAIVPVNMRQEEEKHDYGNRISVVTVDIPLNARDPLERLRKVKEYSQAMKQSSLTIGIDVVLTVPSLYPSFTQPLVWNQIAPRAFALLAHTWCTNVAGPPLPVYVMGRELKHTYGYFPLNPSMGLATVILSYNGRITMTLVADEGIIPNVLELRDDLQIAYSQLRQAAHVPEMPLTPPVKIVPAPAKPTIPTPAAAQPAVEINPAPQPAAAIPVMETPQPPASPPVEKIPAPPVATVPVAETPLLSTSEPVKPEKTPEEPVPPAAESTTPIPPEAPAPIELPVPAAVPTGTSTNGAAPAGESLTLAVEAVAVAAAEAPNGDPLPDDEPMPIEAASIAAEEPKTETAPPVSPKLFSEEWAQAYQKVINASASYRAVSHRWDLGQIAFVMHPSVRDGIFAPTAVLLDLHRGDCRNAHNVAVEKAVSGAAFAIEGDYANWMKVLRGEADPLKMLMRGGLRLHKGSLIRLLPFTQSAQELVKCAQQVSTKPSGL